MDRDEKINSILTAIQDNSKLLLLLKLMITKNLPDVTDEQLDLIIQTLGI